VPYAPQDIVTAVSDVAGGLPDERVLEMAVQETAVLLTEDKDFGRYVYSEGRATGGVIFVRYPARFRADLPRVVLELVAQRGETLVGKFTVVQLGRIRIRRKPRG